MVNGLHAESIMQGSVENPALAHPSCAPGSFIKELDSLTFPDANCAPIFLNRHYLKICSSGSDHGAKACPVPHLRVAGRACFRCFSFLLGPMARQHRELFDGATYCVEFAVETLNTLRP